MLGRIANQGMIGGGTTGRGWSKPGSQMTTLKCEDGHHANSQPERLLHQRAVIEKWMRIGKASIPVGQQIRGNFRGKFRAGNAIHGLHW